MLVEEQDPARSHLSRVRRHVSGDACISIVQARASHLAQLSSGHCPSKINRLLEEANVFCASGAAGLGFATFAGDVNADYNAAALAFVGKALTGPQYLSVSRDRSRKRRLADKDPCWLLEYQLGDDDHDLVPNVRDKCPKTPLLVATDDHGCPTNAPLPAAPPDADVRTFLNAFGFAANGQCNGAPPPLTPSIASFTNEFVLGSPTSGGAFLVSKMTNQPAGCPVVYVIQVEAVVQGQPRSYQLSFRQEEGTPVTTPLGVDLLLLRALPTDAGDRGKFAQLLAQGSAVTGATLDASLRARVANGNGQVSLWGETRYVYTRYVNEF